MTFSDYSILLGNRMNIALFYLHSAYTKAMRQPQLRQGEIACLLLKILISLLHQNWTQLITNFEGMVDPTSNSLLLGVYTV